MTSTRFTDWSAETVRVEPAQSLIPTMKPRFTDWSADTVRVESTRPNINLSVGKEES